jgi:hypothetical protein
MARDVPHEAGQFFGRTTGMELCENILDGKPGFFPLFNRLCACLHVTQDNDQDLTFFDY